MVVNFEGDDGKTDSFARFGCINKNSCASVSKEVECAKSTDGKWNCRVKEFELPQSIAKGLDAIEVAKKIGAGDFGSAGEDAIKAIGDVFVGIAGEPKYLVYFESFPQGRDAINYLSESLDAVNVGRILP